MDELSSRDGLRTKLCTLQYKNNNILVLQFPRINNNSDDDDDGRLVAMCVFERVRMCVHVLDELHELTERRTQSEKMVARRR